MEKNRVIFDVHSHVQFPVYDADRAEVIQRAKDMGVHPHTKQAQDASRQCDSACSGVGVKMLAVGTQASTSEAAIRLAQEYPEDVWATVGFHPNHLSGDPRLGGVGWYHDTKEQKEAAPEQFDIAKLRELARDPKVVAIGECGLDYYRLDKEILRQVQNKQKEVFIMQAQLAQELDKALMIHCRPSKGTDDAYEDLLQLLIPNFQLPKVVHFYVGSPAITKKLIEAGFYFTFGGVITFARDYDESLQLIPLDRILLETDCPYVAPQSMRGKRNEPAFIIEAVQKLAEIKETSLDAVIAQTYENSLRVFKIK